MKLYKCSLFIFTLFFYVTGIYAQIVINEVSYSNKNQVIDEDGDSPDWIELYNTGSNPFNLKNYQLSDNLTAINNWVIPNITLNAGERKLIFASGKNRPDLTGNYPTVDHWETAVYDDVNWNYKIGDQSIPSNWNELDFIASGWLTGKGGIGYGDNDDNSVVPEGTISVYSRTTFTVSDPSVISAALLNIDYDDGFVAYLNGIEIARAGLTGNPPSWDEFSTEHESELYSGGLPVKFSLNLNLILSILKSGVNVLAIEVHNLEVASSDLSMRAFLNFGIKTTDTYWGPNPGWFNEPTGFNSFELHTNFKLKAGETLVLWDINGALVDSLKLVDLELDHVSARIPDGLNWCVTDTPSPDGSNDKSICFQGYSSTPVLDHDSGFYTGNQNIGIKGNDVRYTLDGSIPDQNSSIYTGPININKSSVLRARSFENGKLPGTVVNGSYFINEATKLPVVSISAKPADLFDDGTGSPAIYDNYWTGEKAPCHVSYFDKNKKLKFEDNASINIVGNFSVSFAQKSLQFIFDEDFGAKDDVPNYIFNEDKPSLKKLHGFRVRNLDDDAVGARMRDPIANRIALPTNAVATASQNVAVFINGIYWGHYAARELLNKYFFKDNYNVNIDSLDIIKSYYNIGTLADHGTIDGFNSMINFITNCNINDSLIFDQVKSMIDLENWADYWALQIFVANGDWYSSVWVNNVECFKSYAPDLKWKFVIWDAAYSQGNGQSDCEADFNSLDYALIHPVKKNIYTPLFNNLLKNPYFKKYFINRFADLVNYYWTTQKVHKIIDNNVASMASEIMPNFDRWDPVCTSYCPPDLNSWQSYVQQLKDFYTERPEYQKDHINKVFSLGGKFDITLNVDPPEAGKIRISTIIPDKLPWTGTYFNGNPVEITGIPNLGYTFSNWSASEFISDTNSVKFEADIDESTLFTAHFTGSKEDLNLTISEINYNSDSTRNSGNWIELHNYGTESRDISGYKFTTLKAGVTYNIPANTIIDANAYLVLVDDVSKFTDQFPGVTNFIGPTNIKLNNSNDSIIILDQSSQPVLVSRYSDTIPWPQCADGYGRTLENAFDSDLSHLLNSDGWFDGCMGGSPGKAYSPCNEQVIFNEINYHSPENKNAKDWVELINHSGQPKDLSGWKFLDSKENEVFIFPTGTFIKPDSFLVIYADLDSFQSIHPDNIPLTGPFKFGLNNDGEVIRLFDSSGKLYLSMFYNDASPWSKEPDGEGPSLELKVPGTDLNIASNWEPSCFNGTPGRPNTDCTTSTINLVSNNIYIVPNPSTGLFNITGLKDYNSIRILNISGEVIKEINLKSDNLIIDLSEENPGIYFIQAIGEKSVKTNKLILTGN